MKTGVHVWRHSVAWPKSCFRLDPEKRLCSQWDATGIRKFPVAPWDQMGFQVLDDFCMEHIM